MKIADDVDEFREKTCALDAEANQMKDLFDSDEMKYLCPNCNKQYKTSGGIKRHLKTVHEFSFDSEDFWKGPRCDLQSIIYEMCIATSRHK